jgi:hypothetical protein
MKHRHGGWRIRQSLHRSSQPTGASSETPADSGTQPTTESPADGTSPQMADINRLISTLEEAVELTPKNHSDRPGYLSYLGISLQMRFAQLGSMADIDRAI